jgi:hypothetical protein
LQYLGTVEECYKKYGRPVDVLTNTNYLDNFYVGRKRALQADEYPYMALTLIEGVSAEIAKAIIAEHGSLVSLIGAYSECADAQRATLLQDIKHGESARRVGPALSKRIFEFLFRGSQ